MSSNLKDLRTPRKDDLDKKETASSSPNLSTTPQKTIDRVESSLDNLSIFSRMVLRMRYGLETGAPMDHEEISDVLQIRVSRVKELEEIALRHLAYKKRALKH